MGLKNTERFSNRVEDYVKYRPGYPQAIAGFLEGRFGLVQGATIADVGSGTGILSALFLEQGYRVLGIEPNAEMREKSVQLLGTNPFFSCTRRNGGAYFFGSGERRRYRCRPGFSLVR